MYTIGELADLAGVTRKTLRHYDKIGLLEPQTLSEAGYRLYGQAEVDLLQQILFFKEMGIALADIRSLVHSPDYQVVATLNAHLTYLSKERRRIDRLIETVRTTIKAQRGEIIMLNEEKFEAFKQQLIDENEAKFGGEVRAKYGDDQMDEATKRLMGIDHETWGSIEMLTVALHEHLAEATAIGDTTSPLAKEVFELHQEWLQFYVPENNYSLEMHRNLGEMYVADERFTAHYDAVAPGAAVFLRDVINHFAK